MGSSTLHLCECYGLSIINFCWTLPCRCGVQCELCVQQVRLLFALIFHGSSSHCKLGLALTCIGILAFVGLLCGSLGGYFIMKVEKKMETFMAVCQLPKYFSLLRSKLSSLDLK